MRHRQHWIKFVWGIFVPLFLAWIIFPSPSFAAAGINKEINFQGKLVDNNGVNVADNTYTVVFSIYNVSSAGSATWTESDSVTTSNGIFQVALGAVTSLPGSLDFNTDTWYLGIKVGSDAEMTPRIRLTAVPYAFNSSTVNGLTLSGTDGNTYTFPTTNNGTIITSNAPTQTITSTQTSGTILGISDSTAETAALVGQSITLSGSGAFDQTGLQFNLSNASGTNLNDIVGTGSTWKISKSGALTVASCSGCGGGGGSLQGSYNGGNTITTTSGNDIAFTLASGLGTSTKFSVTNNHTSNTTDVYFNNANASGTNTNGLFIEQTGAGVLTNGFQIKQTSGTLTNGLVFTGTIANDITTGTSGRGLVINTNGAGTISLDTGGAAGITIGGTNANAITLGNTTTNTTLTLSGTGLTTLGGNLTVNGTTQSVGNGSNYTIQTSSNAGLTLLSAGTGSITLGQNAGLGNIVISPNAGGQAALVVNDRGVGDIFTASASGTPTFRITNSGAFLFQDSIIVASGSGSTGNGSGASVNALGDEGSLIPNAGFESAITSVWGDGWFPAATDSAGIFSRDTSTPAKGTASLLVTMSPLNNPAIYSSCIPLAGGLGSYTLNFYAKSASTTKVTIAAVIDTFGSKANCQSNTTPTLNVAKAAFNVTGTSTWSTYGSGTNAVTLASGTWARVHFIFTDITSALTAEIDGVRLTESTTGQGLDYAENYPTDALNSATAGDVVTLKPDGPLATVIPATDSMDSPIGVVSTNPGYVLDDGSVSDPKVPVALSGRVPVKVNTQNGPIHLGDYLTASSVPGVAAKAINPGAVIGTALEDYIQGDPNQAGEIMMFIKNTYYDGKSNGLIGGGTNITGMIGQPSTSNSSQSNIPISTPSAILTASDSADLTVSSLNVNGLATVSGDFRVKGGGLIEGILSVADTLTTNNFLVNAISDFFGQVNFHNVVTFDQAPLFGKDTAGVALMQKGQQKVAVNFSQPYQNAPVVTASIVLDQKQNPDGSIVDQSNEENSLVSGGYSYIISQRNTKGFIIVVNKPAESDINFSWTAIGVSNLGVSGSDVLGVQSNITLTPTPAISLTPILTSTSASVASPSGF